MKYLLALFLLASCVPADQERIYREVLKTYQGDNDIVVVFYSAEWCSYCKKAKPVFKELEKKGYIKLLIIDIDRDPPGVYGDLVAYVPRISVYRKSESGKMGLSYSGHVPNTKDAVIESMFEGGSYNEEEILTIAKPLIEE
jgi:thiol-disulfide isomerase/thioredoxin